MIEIKEGLLSLLLAIFSLTTAFAQSAHEIQTRMDEVKLDESLVYGEDLNDDRDMAFQNALIELTTYSNELRMERGLGVITTSDLLTAIKELKYQTGSRHTVLVYLPMDQMLDIVSKSPAEVVSTDTTSELRQDTPSQGTQNGSHEERAYFVPDRQQGASNVSNNNASNNQTPLPDDITQTLCGQDNWLEIKGFLTAYKRDGRIRSVGNVLTYAEVPEDAYAILMDDMGGILSILSPKNSKTRINYRTNQVDNESNHSDCKFIVWYK